MRARRLVLATETSRALAVEDLAVLHEHLALAHERLEGATAARRIVEDLRSADSTALAAEAGVRSAATADDLVSAIGLLAASRRVLAGVEAYVLAESPPVGHAMCFFDPAHGAADTDARWTSVRYGTRSVPVCLQDAVLLAAGVQPDGRAVVVDGTQPVAYWEVREWTAPYLLGYFGGHPLLAWLGDRGHRLPKRVTLPPGAGGTLDVF